jgi:hypothetical protein
MTHVANPHLSQTLRGFHFINVHHGHVQPFPSHQEIVYRESCPATSKQSNSHPLLSYLGLTISLSSLKRLEETIAETQRNGTLQKL